MVLDSRRSEPEAPAPPKEAAFFHAPAPPRRAFGDLTGRVPTVVALAFAAAWIGLEVLIENLAPAADPEAPLSAFDVLVTMTFLYALLGTFIGMGARRRWGLASSMAGGAVLLGAGLLCLFTGHSGLWLAAQVGGGAAMLALSFGALKATA